MTPETIEISRQTFIILELLNNGFILLIIGLFLKAAYILFKTVLQTNENTKDIQELQQKDSHCGQCLNFEKFVD